MLAFQAKCAEAIVAGIMAYLGIKVPAITWDPSAEIEKLRAAGLINSQHQPPDPVNWGEFATVINRMR